MDQADQSGFPKVYIDINTGILLDAFKLGPQRLSQVLSGLNKDDLKANPKPKKWSIQEIVLHLADAEIMGAARIRQIFAQPGSSFVTYEQDIWANNFAYRSQDISAIESALNLFKCLRETSYDIFRRAEDIDWAKKGMHPDFGPISLRQLLELYADHSERHIGQILELRTMLGKKFDFSILLKERLY
jgi:uncharacterized damage-inducible protein DinB